MSLFSRDTIVCEVVDMEIARDTVAPIPKEESDDRLVHALKTANPVIFPILKLMASTGLPKDWQGFRTACFSHEFLYQMATNLMLRETEFSSLGADNKTVLEPRERQALQTWLTSDLVQETRKLEFETTMKNLGKAVAK